MERALESSLAERLQDLPRNSMDSIGVSGRTHELGNQLAGPFSSMFSSRVDEHLTKHELTETISTNTSNK